MERQGLDMRVSALVIKLEITLFKGEINIDFKVISKTPLAYKWYNVEEDIFEGKNEGKELMMDQLNSFLEMTAI
ncbi:hypothetical protein CCACVL1_25705 [Corchorus capsularis]|uniref:Uncharacterized protein n=1 Tax=Corchorus capsularis TaxID=210143 RepID=A0A1R3GHW5_COCAP|nr:hypothetical protein CCACVL1_25705 [Corchorus capsularis]